VRKYLDKKLLFILVVYIAAYHVIYISRGILLKLNNIGAYANLSWKSITFDPIITNLIAVPPVVLMILVVTKKMIDRDFKWRYIIAAHFIFSLIYGFLLFTFSNIYKILFYEKYIETFNLKSFFIDIITSSNLQFLGYVGFVSIIYSYYYITRNTEVRLQKIQLSAQLTNVKMEALKSQLNPHFLFNTLHSISSLIKEDAHKAQNMIASLGDLLREVLQLKHKNLISLKEEIIVLNKYLEIIKLRFSDHLTIEMEMDENIKDALIPSMIIQPIIENSFNHGYSYNITNLIVKLHIYKKDEHLYISIKNNGKPIEENKASEGIGIKNVKERLIILYEHDFEFIFKTLQKKVGVITIIKIPFWKNH